MLYAVIGQRCIFTGLTYDATSTINACEAIVEEIARLERRRITDLIFYDLQTHVTYDSKAPGEFEIDRIVIKGLSKADDEEPDEDRIVIKGPSWTPGWDTARLPADLVEKFRPCIGQLDQVRTYDEAQREIAKAYRLVLTIPELN
ncbi:MAG: hypothetical protein NTV81_04720 [Candidatus Komeilibacteria bacterium]|nr:hypothetical protein [Candidatus Komeilibacteria bacterium]